MNSIFKVFRICDFAKLNKNFSPEFINTDSLRQGKVRY